MSNVLVVFQANTEHVEQLALAVAVGAVEADALIRLRRLAAANAPDVGHKSYGRLQAGDLQWASAVVMLLEDATPNFEELDPMLDLLGDFESASSPAWTFSGDGPESQKTESQRVVEKALADAGFLLINSEDGEADSDEIGLMKRLGRRAAGAGLSDQTEF